jgi:heme exporter protein A
MFTAEALACVRGERAVFDGVGFAVDAGGVLVLTGPNGSGKSSLLRLCAGLLAPAGGRLCWDGADVARDADAHRARLHYIGHLDGLKTGLTALENLRLLAALCGARPDDAALMSALERLGIAHLADTPARFLSAGQRRRLTLARLAAAPRPLWLLDEPTTALDTAGIAVVTGMVADHRAAGGRAVLSTHVPFEGDGAGSLSLGSAP